MCGGGGDANPCSYILRVCVCARARRAADISPVCSAAGGRTMRVGEARVSGQVS